MRKPITSYSGVYRWLSNFYYSPMKVRDPLLGEIVVPDVEHGYQMCKSVHREVREAVLAADSPGEAKRIGQHLLLRDDWKTIQLDVMRFWLKKKFEIIEMRERLIDTGSAELIEGNYWHDTYWGVCDGVGENWLGKLQMERRDVLLAAHAAYQAQLQARRQAI